MGRTKLLRQAVMAALVLALAVGSGVHYFSRGMHRVADGFIAAIDDERLPEASAFLAESLRSANGEAWLKNLLAESDLADARAGRWTSHRSANGYGELQGTIVRHKGTPVPVTVLLVKEQIAWKIYAIRRPYTDPLPAPLAPLLPGREERVTLVKRAIQDFAASVQSRNMSYFRSTIAPSRREQYTTEELTEAFGHFFDIQEDLSSLEKIEPQLEEMTRSAESGEVTLSGYFATAPKQVHFRQKYAYEQTDWRLLSFKIDMK